jgi:glycosyltransferase involved in cell wall biosynthesis
MLVAHRRRGTWDDDVDLFVALSAFARDKMVEGGFDCQKVSVIPHFVEDPGPSPQVPRDGSILFIGRLSAEKGVADLIRAAARLKFLHRVRIVGDGPERDRLKALSSEYGKELNIVAGALPRSQIIQEFRNASCVVQPSHVYETFGRSIMEGFASGRPAIVPRHGALTESVCEGQTGFSFEPGDVDSLAGVLERALSNVDLLQGMGREARAEYESKYTPEIAYRTIIGVHKLAFERAAKRVPETMKRFPKADPTRSPFEWVRDDP